MRIKFSTLVVVLLVVIANKSIAQWNLTGNANATTTSILGTTNAIPLNLTTRNLTRMVIDSNGKVGIGIAAPPNVFSVKGSGGTPAAVWVSAGGPIFTGFGEQTVGNADYILSMASTLSNARPVFIGRRSKGTLAAPLSMANNDFIMSFLSSAYDGTAFQNPAAIDFFVDGTPSAGNVPARISFVTGSNSSNRAERLKIGNTGDISMNNNQLFVQKSTGNIGVGTISPTAKMELNGQIKITGGTPAAGKVLTSDSAGLASWQSIPSGAETDPQVSASAINKIPKWNGTTLIDGSITDNGNIGIGEANPQGILHVSQPFNFSGVNFTGTGLNDLTANTSGYTGTATTSYAIRIQNPGPDPNIIEISNDGGTTFGSPVAISNPVALANGVTASFAATGGHTFGDQWSWSVSPGFTDILIVKDGKVGIATTTPAAKLDINGDALINTLTVGTGNGNDNSNTALGKDALKGNQSVLNTAVGFDALTNNTSGSQNTGVGCSVLTANLSGSFNTAIGMQSMVQNISGSENIAIGTFSLEGNKKGNANIAIGQFALNDNDSGSNNVAIGRSAMVQNVSGKLNVAIGNRALRNNVSGSLMVAVGDSALCFNNTGNNNVAVGAKAMKANVSGSSNTVVGHKALQANITGSNLVAIGDSALQANSGGNNNVAIGSKSLRSNTSGIANVALGANTLLNVIGANDNIAIGDSSQANSAFGTNVAIGSKTLRNNTTGTANVAIGLRSMNLNTTGFNNVAVGDSAMIANTTGESNVAVGKNALRKNTAGDNNIALGEDALSSQENCFSNIAIGDSAMATYNSVGQNVAIGSKALSKATSGSYNVAIGYNALRLATADINVAIGGLSMEKNTTGLGNTAVGVGSL